MNSLDANSLILCSGELYADPIPTSECLACALRLKKPPCGYGYRILKAIFMGQEDRTSEIHVTDVNNCLLKSYLDKTEPVPEMVHKMFFKFIGIAIHNALDFNDDHVWSEVPVSGLGIVGRIDAIIDGSDIEDVKTTRKLTPWKTQGNHDIQLNIYRHLAGKRGDLRVQYLDMMGPTKCLSCGVIMEMIGGVVQCPLCGHTTKSAHLGAVLVDVPVLDPDDVKGLIEEQVTELKMALATKTPPPPAPGWLCGYCGHTECPFNKSNGDNNGTRE